MGKYENTLKQVQIRNLLSEKKYDKALEMAEAMIANGRISDVSELKLYADIFRKCEKYETAKELYKEIYEEIHTRRVLYNLIVLCIKSKSLDEAEELYKDYLVKNNDSIDAYILRYRIDKAKRAEREILINDLEKIKQCEYSEEWAYELAKQYHKAGMIEECIEECRQIILWFSEGEIAEKAKLLKMHHEGVVSEDLMVGIEQSIGNDVSRYMEAQSEQASQEEVQTVSEEVQIPQEEPQDVSNDVSHDELSDMQPPQEDTTKDVKLSSFAKYIDYKFGCTHLKEEKEIEKGNLSFVLASENQEIIMSTVQIISKLLDRFAIISRPKIAKIDAANLNNLSLEDEVSNLVGTCILIENAAQMTMKTINSIIKVMDAYPKNIAIILVDKEENISKMLFKEEILRNQLSHFILL